MSNRRTPRAALPLAIYYRVSTGKQAKPGWREAQLRPILRMFEAFGWSPPPDEYYFKDAASAFRGGGLSKRNDFRRMIDLARAGVIRGFVVHTPDRFFRNAFNSFASYPELVALGVEGWVADPDGPWNMFDPANEERFMREMVDSHNFSRRLARHITKGKNRVADAGLFNGPRLPRGWVKDENGEAVPNDELAGIKAGAERYLAGDVSLAQLSALMKPVVDIDPAKWGLIFGNPFYAGLVTRPNDTGRTRKNRKGPINLDDYHPGRHAARAPWDVATMVELNKIMDSHRRGGRGAHRSTREYIFGGRLARCHYCGRGLSGSTSSDGLKVYSCTAPYQGLQCEARHRRIRQTVLVEQVGGILRHFSIPPDWRERIAAEAAKIAPEARVRDVALRRIREAREAAYRDIGSKRITPSEFMERLEQIDAEEADVMRNRRPVTVDVERLATALADVAGIWSRMPDARRRNVARLIFSRVEVDVVHRMTRAVELTPDVADLFDVAGDLEGSPYSLERDPENRLRFVVQWVAPGIQ